MSGDTGKDSPRWPWWLLRFPWLLLPVLIGMIQIAGVRGATRWSQGGHGPPWAATEWQHVDPPLFAFMLALVGPLALFALRGFPRTVIAVSAAATITYYSLGYPAGPVFLAPLAALFGAFRMQRRERAAQARRVWEAEAARRAGAERLLIAQELHDLLAHHISLISVQSGVALHLLDEQPQQARPALTAIKSASSEALGALRGALEALRNTEESAPRAPTAGLDQLETVAESVRRAGVDVTVDIRGAPEPLDPAVDLAGLRIVQESLTNVLRHSQASHVDVTVEYGEQLIITVRDNGSGGIAVPGNGITGMNERARAVGGALTAEPSATGGFEVRAHLPRR